MNRKDHRRHLQRSRRANYRTSVFKLETLEPRLFLAADWLFADNGQVDVSHADHVNELYAQESTIDYGSSAGGTTLQSPGFNRDIVLLPDKTVFVATRGSGLVESTHTGDNWAIHNVGIAETNIHSVAVSPAFSSDQTLFVGTRRGAYRSSDGGESWNLSKLQPGSQVAVIDLALSPDYPSDGTIFASGFAPDDPSLTGVYRHVGGGRGWSQLAGLPQFTRVHTILFSPTDADIAFVGLDDEGIYKTVNGVAFSSSGLPGDTVLSLAISPDFNSDQTVFAGTQASGLFKSADGGMIWSQVGATSFGGASINSISVSPSFASDSTVIAGTSTGLIYKTTDDGDTWVEASTGITAGVVSSISISPGFTDDQTVMISSDNGVFRSRDGGESWQPVQNIFRYDNTNSGLTFTGNWSTVADRSSSGRGYRQSSFAGDHVTFSFLGNGFRWLTIRGPDQGRVDVFVDGQRVATVDLFDDELLPLAPGIEVGGLDNALHTVTIELLDNKAVTVDAVDIFNNSGASSGFLGVTAEAGLKTEDDLRPTTGNPAWGDYDGDGFLDLWVSRHITGYSLYHNNQDGTFTDRQILNFTPRPSDNWDLHAAAWGDVNNDGLLDLYMGYGGGGGQLVGLKFDQLYLNQGDGTFDEVSFDAGIEQQEGRVRTVTMLDWENDGLLDIFVINRNAPSRLFHNNGDGTFTDIASEIGLADFGIDGSIKAKFGSWADYDKDGDMDLFTTGPREYLLRNNGNDVEDVTEEAQIEQVVASAGSVSVAWGDYDNDGWIDLFFTGSLVGNFLYRNNGDGTFVNMSETAGLNLAPRATAQAGASWGDYDNDGDLDLYVVYSGITESWDPSLVTKNEMDVLYRNNGDGTFTDVTVSEGLTSVVPAFGDGVAWGDYDNDGFLDLIVTNGHYVPSSPDGRDLLYRNVGNENNWIKIVPQGTLSNAGAVGVKVTIVTDGKLQYREFSTHGGSQRRTQGHGPLHFGLGDSTKIDRLIVDWPSGLHEEFLNVDAGQSVRLVENVGLITADETLSEPLAKLTATLPASDLARVAANESLFVALRDQDGVSDSTSDSYQITSFFGATAYYALATVPAETRHAQSFAAVARRAGSKIITESTWEDLDDEFGWLTPLPDTNLIDLLVEAHVRRIESQHRPKMFSHDTFVSYQSAWEDHQRYMTGLVQAID